MNGFVDSHQVVPQRSTFSVFANAQNKMLKINKNIKFWSWKVETSIFTS
jgi:hypothetical protein